MLGLLHVPDFAPPVVAAMLAEPDLDAARVALDRLVDAQLLEPFPGGRYRLHDLVRLVATERAHDEEGPASRSACVERAARFCTSAMWSAERSLRPTRTVPFGHPPVSDCPTWLVFSKPAEAKRWIDAELPNLVAVLEATASIPSVATDLLPWLSDSIWMNLNIRCEWQLADQVSRITADSAGSSASRDVAACGLLLRGRSEASLGNYQLATEYLEGALSLVRAAGNQPGIVLVLNALGVTAQRNGATEAALSRFDEAIELARIHGLRNVAASVLNNMSVSYACADHLEAAVDAAGQSLAIVEAECDLGARSSAMLSLASVQCLRGEHTYAVELADQVIAVSSETGDRLCECEALIVRAEANRRRSSLRGALVDTGKAVSLADANGYLYVAAVAHRQRSKTLAALGRVAEASVSDSVAARGFAQLVGVFRDPVIELLLRE
jgi:hypothetical protein